MKSHPRHGRREFPSRANTVSQQNLQITFDGTRRPRALSAAVTGGAIKSIPLSRAVRNRRVARGCAVAPEHSYLFYPRIQPNQAMSRAKNGAEAEHRSPLRARSATCAVCYVKVLPAVLAQVIRAMDGAEAISIF